MYYNTVNQEDMYNVPTGVKMRDVFKRIDKGEDLTVDEIDYITSTGVKFTSNESRAYASTPYDSEFVKRMHQIDGSSWNYNNKTWSVPISKTDELKEAMLDVYGADSDRQAKVIITIKLKKEFFGGERLEFHNELICSTNGYSSLPTTCKSHYAFELDDLRTASHSAGSKRSPELDIDKGTRFGVIDTKRDAMKKEFFTDDDLFEVMGYMEIEPMPEMVEQHKKFEKVASLIERRNEILQCLQDVNVELKHQGFPEALDDNGTYGGVDPSKFKKQEKHLRYLERRKIREAMRNAKGDPEKLKKLQKEQEDRKKAEAERKAAEERKQHFFVSPADVIGATERAISVKYQTTNFWFPKSYTKPVSDGGKIWFDLKHPSWMKIVDAEHKENEITHEELVTEYGNVEKAKIDGNEYDLEQALAGKYQPKLEAKEVEADESLKR